MNILLIEDSMADVEIIKILLNESKVRYKVFEANTLAKGFDIVRDNEIKIVLLDLSIGDSTGINTVVSWVQREPNIPVVVLTGTDNQRIGLQAVKSGAQDYLIKSELDSRRLSDTITYSLTRFNNEAALRKQNETLSKDTEELETNQRLAGLGAWELDIVTNTMRWRKETFQIFGLPPNSFSPTRADYLNYVHREDRELVENFFDDAIKTGKPTFIKHRIIIDMRVIKYLSVRAQVKFDEDTNRVLLSGSVQDITEKKIGQQAPIDTEAQPEAPLLAPEQIFSQLSYNIRSPLSSVINLLYLLDRTPMNTLQQDLMRDLRTSIDDLSFILSNVINYSLLVSDKDSIHRDAFKLPEMLESIRRVLQFKAQQADGDLAFHIEGDLPEMVYGDANKISQYIYGELELALLRQQGRKAPEIIISTRINQKAVSLILEVKYVGREPERYSGAGFSSEDLIRLIGENRSSHDHQHLVFFATDKLGQLLEVNRDLRVIKSRQDVHIKYSIPLLLAEGETLQRPQSPLSPISILLAEDHPVQKVAARKLLTTWSDFVQVIEAKNGQEAIDKTKDRRYDVILMDLQMPIVDGLQAIETIRTYTQTPIIAVTANANKVEEEKVRALGANDYLVKPFEPEELYRRIIKLLYPNAQNRLNSSSN